MDAFATLDLVAPQATATEAVQSILSAVEAIPFAPENIGAPVQLMGHDEAAGTFHDYLWIGGLSEESWPPHQTPNPFLPLGLQAGFGVTQAVAELQTAAARRTLQRLTAASGMTIFSSPQSAEGASLHPSRMIASLRRIEGRELILDDAGGWRRAEGLGQLCESLEDTQAPPLKPEELLHHGTKVLELQSLCPFHAFAEMRLSAGGRDAAEPGVRRRDRGRILERALQLLWERLGESRALHSLSAEARRTSIAEATGQALAELFDAPGDPLHGPLAEIERQCICSLIDKWLEVELARPEFTVEAHQRKIEFTLGGLPLRGCIDRLDRVGQGMEILDYKASEYYKSSNWQTPRPVQPQLPLYALAMRAEGQTVAALAFARITEKECKLDGVAVDPSLLSKSRGGGDSLDARMDEWQAELSRLAAGHLAGEAAVDPKVAPEKGGGSCKFCQLAALCRIAEKEPEDADEEGEGGDE
jgi:probable DNA repair protein